MEVKPITKDLLKDLKYSPQTGIMYRTKSKRGCKAGPVRIKNNKGYFTITINGKTYSQHRLAVVFVTGKDIPEGMVVDHINGVCHDNRWANLRVVTQSENQRNRVRHRAKRTPYVIFYPQSNRWKIVKSINKKMVHFGVFKTEEEAIDEANRLIKAGWPMPDNSPKNITFAKERNRWRIIKKISNKTKAFGQFKTQSEAIKRRDELIKNGWKKYPH